MDGALGAHGAWLLQPYSDLPESTGLNTAYLSSLQQTAELAIQNGYQLCIHAIGDRANREVLDLYQRTFEAYPDHEDLRWRVEHAQHLHPDDIPRFAQLGVLPAMQAIHATSDGPWVIRRLGRERAAEGAYVWRSLLDSGAFVVNGTDAPVEDVDPLRSFYASVTRQMDSGDRFFPAQCMTREEALRTYTLNAAFAAFQEMEKGSLTPGKLADITILSDDILTIPEEQIPLVKVTHTILGGEVVYSGE
jgi:predicted amidohydrolase YtcJ